MGAAIGAATGHIGIWVAAGIAAYIAITLVGGAWNKRPQRRENDRNCDTNCKRRTTNDRSKGVPLWHYSNAFPPWSGQTSTT